MKNFFHAIFFSLMTLICSNVRASESLSYSGRLVNANGSPVSGPVNLKVELAYTNAPSSILCSQDFSNVILSNGVFHLKVDLDCGSPVTLSQVLNQIPANESAAIRVTDVTHSKTYSFQALHSMPFANIAETSKQLIQMGASDGQVLKWSNSSSKWVPGSPGGGGTVTNVSASAPLSVTNGGTTPALTIAKANSTTDGYLSAADWSAFNNKIGVVTGGTIAQYYRGDNSWQTLNTSVVPESGVTNLYFSNARVLGVPLDGFVAGPGVIAASDTVLEAFGKTQGQINSLVANNANFLIKNGTDSITGEVTVASPTGFLRITDPPAIFTDATNMAYVDSRDDLKVNKAGDTMSGLLTLDNNVRLKGGANYVTLKAHATTSASYNFVFPQTAGTSGFVLSTDGSGNTTWINSANVANGTDTVTSASIVDGAIMDADVNASAAIAQSKIANLTTDLAGKEATVTNPNDTTKYYRGDKTWQTLNTTAVAEAANLYFTNARVLGVDLAGLNTSLAGPISSVDTVIDAFGKIQNQVTTLKGNGQWSKTGSDIYFNTGNVGVGTSAPGSALDVKGTLRFSGSTSGFVGLVPPAVAGSTVYTLPSADGSAGQILKTNGAGVLSWVNDNTGAGAYSGAINKAVITDGTGALGTSATTSTELGFVSGVTSSIQTQLDSKQSATLSSGKILVGNGSNVATAVTPSSDVSMTNDGAFTVTKLQGKAVSTTAPVLGSFLKWDNVLTQWAPTTFATCSGANQVMHYVLLTDTWSCDTLTADNILPAQTANNGKFLTTDGTTASWQSFSGVTGSGTTNYLPKFTAASTLGDSLIFDNGSKVGVGTNVPVNTLSVLAPYGSPSNFGTGANGGFRLMNPTNAVVLDMGIGINTTAWLQARDPSNYATVKNMLLNAVGGTVTIGGSNETVALSTGSISAANGVFGVVGNNAASASSYGIAVLANNRTTPAAGDTAGELRFSMNNNAGNRDLAFITAKADGTGGANGYGGSLIFSSKSDNVLSAPGERMRITSSGNVGIGTATPGTKLEVAGQVKITGGVPGAGKVLTSDAAGLATWETPAAGGITSLNGLIGTTQTFATPETTGTAPNWSSSGSAHTINIPMASAAGVTAGLISKSDYDSFNSKLGTTLNSGNILVGNGANVATAVTPSSDVSMTNAGAFTVTKLQGRSVSTTAPVLGSFLKWDNILSQWAPTPLATCSGANQVMHYILLTDTWSCDTLTADNILPTQTANNGKFLTTDGTTASWQTFSGVTGSGTTNYLPKFTAASTIGNSLIYDNGTSVGIGTATPATKLDVAGSARFIDVGIGARQLTINGGSTAYVQITNSTSGSASTDGINFEYNGHNFNIVNNENDATFGGPVQILSAGTSNSFVVNREKVGIGDYTPDANFEISLNAITTGNAILVSSNDDTDGDLLTMTKLGNVAIGTTTPGSSTKLNVAGQIKSGSASIATGSVDWVSGNSITTSFDCGSNITLANLRDGGSYTLVVTGTGTTQCNFSTTTTGDDAATVTYRFKPTNGVRTATSHTVYSLLRIGTIVYVSWISGF